MALTKRSPGLVILFTILTCGIYYIFWFIATTNEIEASLKEKDGSVSSGGLAFLFSILSCGIYIFYWYYKQGQRVHQLARENDIAGVSDNSTLYIILQVLTYVTGITSIIALVLLQSDLSKIADRANA